MPRTLLTVFAHPDDETFSCGGTIAKYASEGVRVVSICATRGEVGQISDPSLATSETLGEVREQELREACRLLGVQESGLPGLQGLRDGGHVGEPGPPLLGAG